MTNVPWTETEDEFVRAGVVSGLSLREIGDALGRTRNMIARRVQTLGLQRPVVTSQTSAVEAVEEEIEEEITELPKGPVRLIDVGALACRWPLWQDAGAPDFLVCGAVGYPYCAKHRRKAGQRQTPSAVTVTGG